MGATNQSSWTNKELKQWRQKNPVLKFVLQGRMPKEMATVCAGTMQSWSSAAKDALMVAENAETCAAQAVELCRLKREGKNLTVADLLATCGDRDSDSMEDNSTSKPVKKDSGSGPGSEKKQDLTLIEVDEMGGEALMDQS